MKLKNAWCSAAMGLMVVAGLRVAIGTSQTSAQSSAAPTKLSGPQTKNPAWPYADAYDEVTAAVGVYRVRYEDDHIRLVEVGLFPGGRTDMHGDPFPTVTASDAPEPKITDVKLEPDSKLNGQGAGHAPP